MDALPFAATTPVSVGRVGLLARDAGRLAGFYRSVLGLKELRNSGREIGLGTADRELLAIEESPSLREDDPRSAGLYHTAFLLPRRADLARWTQHAIDTGVAIDGASDHFVSEAIYLTDPEGNGIEIYADRDPAGWRFDNGTLRMGTERLDFQNLMAELGEGGAGWSGVPDAAVIGHVHLRVGDAAVAEQWWNEEQGLDTMVRYGGQAVFLSSGGYHHHIGANSWQSRGAGPRAMDTTGLAFVELFSRTSHPGEAIDPWGNLIRTVTASFARKD